jgi:hypothetical protein
LSRTSQRFQILIGEVFNQPVGQTTPTRKPIFNNDYRLTDEDHEAAVFIRMSHDPADVAQIGDYDITAEHLKPTVEILLRSGEQGNFNLYGNFRDLTRIHLLQVMYKSAILRLLL